MKLIDILKEIKVNKPIPTSGTEVAIKSARKYGKELSNVDLKIGKYDAGGGNIQRGYEMTWDEALDKKAIDPRTAARVMNIAYKLDIIPEKVTISWNVHRGVDKRTGKRYSELSENKSTYVWAKYGDEPILFAQRQTRNGAAGQFYVYSRYKKSGKAARMGNDNSNRFMEIPAWEKEWGSSDIPETEKKEILQFLQIEP